MKGWYGDRYNHGLASKGIRTKQMKARGEITKYLVVYNARYENPNNRSIEGWLEGWEDFEYWLKEHNRKRIEEGNEPESAEEFDVIPVNKLI